MAKCLSIPNIKKISYALLFHSLTVLSLEQEASWVPVGFTATSYTAPLCPMNFYGRELGLKPQVIIMPSVDEDINCLRFGLNKTWVILSLWPLNDLMS